MAVSIKTIARQLQVNPSTVSRALSGTPGVSEDTRRRVREAADQLGYVPDTHARDLRTQRRTSIGIICRAEPTAVTTARNYALLEQGRAAAGRAHLIVRNPSESLSAVVTRALSEKHGALILNRPGGELDGTLLGRVSREDVTVVSIDQWVEGAHNIVIDRQVGIRQASRLLFGAGRRRIRIFSAANLSVPDDRLRGFAAGFAEAGHLLSPSDLVLIGASTMAEGYALTKRLLEGEPPDALFCYSDQMAVGAMRAAVEAGIAVGRDLYLVGFDDLEIARYLPVSLTTVSQPVVECAAAAVELVRAAAEGPVREPVVCRFPTELVIRESAPRPEALSLEK